MVMPYSGHQRTSRSRMGSQWSQSDVVQWWASSRVRSFSHIVLSLLGAFPESGAKLPG